MLIGLVFVEVNSGDLPNDWSFGLRVAGVMIAVILFAGLLWRRYSLTGRIISTVVTGSWWP